MTRDEFSDLLGMDVSHETFAQLEVFAGLVRKWGKAINLIATSDHESIWFRHILDSAQLMRHVSTTPDKWVDIGTGGGFPGLVVAIMCADSFPATHFDFLESDHRKASFLREAVRVLGLKVTVHPERAEVTSALKANVASARALAPLAQMIPLLNRHLAKDGVALLLKGKNHNIEIAEARKLWKFNVSIYESITDCNAAVIRLSEVQRA